MRNRTGPLTAPLGRACDNCQWVFSFELTKTTGTWYEEKDGVKGNYWVCSNCEYAEGKFQQDRI